MRNTIAMGAAFGLLLSTAAHAQSLDHVPALIKHQTASIYVVMTANYCGVISESTTTLYINAIANDMLKSMEDKGISDKSAMQIKLDYGDAAIEASLKDHNNNPTSACRILHDNMDILTQIEADYSGDTL